MSWPKGRPRPRKVPLIESEPHSNFLMPEPIEPARAPDEPPSDWRKGALLNVRNRGDAYVITIWPEEYSDERPERALRFTNPALCQAFVSAWYQAEHHDPRAR